MQNLSFKIPNQWNALSDKQLLKLSKLLFYAQNSKTIDYKMFKVFTNYKFYKFKLYRKIRTLFKVRQASEIKKSFSFIYTEQNLTRFIPVVKINRKKYYAPAERLTNLSIGEFSICEDLYLGYLRNVKNADADFGIGYLHYLFAVLYVSSKSKIRPAFNKELLEDLVNNTNKVSQNTLFATLLSYKGCRDAIVNNAKYKYIFPNNKTEATENTPKEIPKSSGFSDVILSFSGKLFGEYDKTYHTNLYTFLDAYEKTLQTLQKQ